MNCQLSILLFLVTFYSDWHNAQDSVHYWAPPHDPCSYCWQARSQETANKHVESSRSYKSVQFPTLLWICYHDTRLPPPRVCFAVPAAMPAAAADILPGFPVSRQTSWAGTDVDRPSLWLTSKLCLASSGRTRGEMEQLVLMKQLQDTNYYVNVLLLSSATANSLLHLEVQSLPCVSVHVCVCFLFS